MAFFGLIGPARRLERAGFQLYGAAVTAARAPWHFAALGVADTLDGRFDLVCVHAFLVIERCRPISPGGPALAQAVFDAMFADMDFNLREMGVGDMAVPKRMRAMWEGFHGRAAAYAAAMHDPAALEAALARNVWRCEEGAAHPPGAARLAQLMRAQATHLAGQSDAALRAGRVAFLAPQEVA